MRVSLIVAMAANGVIGRDNGLPWRLPADLRLFKKLTTGHALILGRKTYESIGRPLPGRRMIVITRRPDWCPPGADGVEVAHSLQEALSLAAGDDEVFVAGGGEIYREALPRADRIYLTQVEAEVEGDTRFPDFDPSDWKIVEEEHHEPDAQHAFPFTFRTLDRV